MAMQRKTKFDPQELLRQVLDNDFDLSAFRQVDESAFKKAPNFVDFMLEREFANATLLPWQVECGMKLFSDYCPHCSNPDYVDELFDEPIAEIRDNVEFLEHGVCRKCKRNRLELFTIGEHHPSKPSMKSESINAMGQRAGKSKFVAAGAAYQLHRWCSIEDPIDYFDLPKMEVVIGTFSALSAEQAEENLWMPFRGLYDAAPWFQKYNEFLKAEQKRLQIPLLEVKDSYIFYVHKRLMLAFTGADDRKKRGRTRLFGAIDEIAFLNSDQGSKANKVMDADKNYAALNNSLATIRKKAVNRMRKFNDYDVPMPVMYNASSPFNVRDKIMRLVKGAVNNAWAVAIHRATWKLNPDYTEADCRNINQGISAMEFDRDFGAIPPFSDSPFMSDTRVLLKLCSTLPMNPGMTAEQFIHVDQMGDRYLALKAKFNRPDKMTPRMLTLDQGYNNNAFAATIFRWDPVQKKPVLDFAVNLMPDREAKLYLNFPAMYDNFILPIVQNLRIMHVYYDRWQSLDQIQRLRDIKIDAQAYSLNYDKDFLPMKQQLNSANIILPQCELDLFGVRDSADPLVEVRDKPVANLLWQCLTVREVGRKLLKPLDGDDDLFRAFALGATRFLVEDIRKKYEHFGSVLTGAASGQVLGRTYSFDSNRAAVNANLQSGRAATFASVRSFRKR